MPGPTTPPRLDSQPIDSDQNTSKCTNNATAVDPTFQQIVLGDISIKPWYLSFYPEELVPRTASNLFVCDKCFKYSINAAQYLQHCKVCDTVVEGEAIYNKENVVIRAVDGEDEKLFTQNLSLFAKNFLDTKSVFYDVTTFVYYLLEYTDPSVDPPRSQVVGFFSKEKLSWDPNNLACILVFPPWQKRGLGQVLMAVSYELAKREGRIGGPEKPLSELGRKAYLHFWAAEVSRYVQAVPPKSKLTVNQMSEETFMQAEDIVSALSHMRVLEHTAKGDAVLNQRKIRNWAFERGVSMESPVDIEAFL